jgi:hypothetical protein
VLRGATAGQLDHGSDPAHARANPCRLASGRAVVPGHLMSLLAGGPSTDRQHFVPKMPDWGRATACQAETGGAAGCC